MLPDQAGTDPQRRMRFARSACRPRFLIFHRQNMIDRATIFVRSGKGGAGCVSLRREKYVPKGGPDGGDGGRGGDVVLVVDPSIDTLLPLTPRPHYRAENGQHGMGKSRHGADGKDCIIKVPPGTLVFDHETGEQIADLCDIGERLVVARGGAGGFGNEHFKSATNQTPREATPGEPWEERTLRLELKLLADVGLIGMPNAGKSTLLSVLSQARPRIADYPFTTLSPNLGMAQLDEQRHLLFADIPGLIEGAAGGAGLGHDFLRHIERTSVLAHLVEVAPADGSKPADNYRAIRRELADYSPDLAAKPELIVLSKADLLPTNAVAEVEQDLRAAADDPRTPILTLSSVTRTGIQSFLEACWSMNPRSGRDTAGWAADSI